MYAVYSYKTTATTAQVLRDIILLLTGTTNLNSLSASCDVATSSIDSTFGVGLNNDYDPGAAANTTQCIRMSVWDNTSEYFYPELAISATGIQIGVRDSWNTGTHVGTGSQAAASIAGSTHPSIGTTAGKLYVWTDGRGIAITSSTYTGHTSLWQITRDDLWRTVANGCRPVIINCAQNAYSAPGTTWNQNMPQCVKSLNTTGAFVTNGTAYANVGIFAQDIPAGTFVPTTGVIDSNVGTQPALIPLRGGMHINCPSVSGGSISAVSPVYYLASGSVPTQLDEIMFGAEKYRPITVTGKLCVRVS